MPLSKTANFKRRIASTGVKLNVVTPVSLRKRDIEVSYIRDPGALETEDPVHGLWQGRRISPDLLTPETLKYAASRSQVFGTILMNFSREIANFMKRPQFDGGPGFSVVPKDRAHSMGRNEKAEAYRIEEMLLRTGRVYNPQRPDMLRDWAIKQVYNRFVYDRMATQVVWGRVTPEEFKALDGSTIIRVDPSIYVPQTDRGRAVAPISYIQIYQDQIWAEFNSSELIFGIANPNPNLSQNGYGKPELMELVEPITIEIMILTYIDRILSQGSIPQGLLILKSQRGGQQLESLSMSSGQANDDLARIIKNQVQGPQNAGRLAVLRLRNGEEAVLTTTDRDLDKMPFIQTYEIIQNQIARKMGVDPAEVGIVQGSIKNSFTDADAKPSRTRQSRSRSATNLLQLIGDVQMNPLIEYINPDFCVHWHGIDVQLEQERLSLEKQQQDMGLLTLNQILAQKNMPTWPEKEEFWWASIPMHPMIFAAEAAKRGLTVKGGTSSNHMGGMNENSHNEMLEGANE